MFRFHLAEHLNKTLAEVGKMSVYEYIGWSAYLKLRARDGNK